MNLTPQLKSTLALSSSSSLSSGRWGSLLRGHLTVLCARALPRWWLARLIKGQVCIVQRFWLVVLQELTIQLFLLTPAVSNITLHVSPPPPRSQKMRYLFSYYSGITAPPTPLAVSGAYFHEALCGTRREGDERVSE